MSLINEMLMDLEHRDDRPKGLHGPILGGLFAAKNGTERNALSVPRDILVATLGACVAVLFLLSANQAPHVRYAVAPSPPSLVETEKETMRAMVTPAVFPGARDEREQPGAEAGSPNVKAGLARPPGSTRVHTPHTAASLTSASEIAGAYERLPAETLPYAPNAEVDLDDETIRHREVPTQPGEGTRTETTAGEAAPEVMFARVPASPDPRRMAEAYYQEALILLRKRKQPAAHDRLRRALDTYPAHAQAREALASQLIHTGRLVEAEDVLRQGLAIVPRHVPLVKLHARIRAEEGQPGKALQILAGISPPVERDPEFHAFRAALLQQMGEHQRAQSLYRAALAVRPNMGVWWTGLAISLEALGERDDAVAAYRQALATGALPAEVLGFVKSKLSMK